MFAGCVLSSIATCAANTTAGATGATAAAATSAQDSLHLRLSVVLLRLATHVVISSEVLVFEIVFAVAEPLSISTMGVKVGVRAFPDSSDGW